MKKIVSQNIAFHNTNDFQDKHVRRFDGIVEESKGRLNMAVQELDLILERIEKFKQLEASGNPVSLDMIMADAVVEDSLGSVDSHIRAAQIIGQYTNR